MVHLKGATGSNSHKIDGLYMPTAEFFGNASVYRKEGDDDVWITYHRPKGKWYVSSTNGKGIGNGYAALTVYPPRPLEDCSIDCWKMYDDSVKQWVEQPSLTVSISTLAEFKEHEVSQVGLCAFDNLVIIFGVVFMHFFFV